MAMPEPANARPTADPLSLVQRPTLAEAGASAPAIRARPNEPFILVHSVQDWEVLHVDGKPTWVPVLSPLPVTPGLFGCRTLDANEPREKAMQDVIAWARNNGRVVVPPSTHVPADLAGRLGEGPYMRKMACRAQANDAVKTRYIQVWDVPVATPPGEDQAFIFDAETNAKWRASLVGVVVEPPSELIMQRIIRTAQSRPARVAGTPYPDKELKEERKQEAQQYVKDRVQAEIPDGTKPRPTPTPESKKKVA